MVTEQILVKLGVKPATAHTYKNILEGNFITFNINTELRVAHFLAQALHESKNFASLTENLNYTPQAILDTFNKKIQRFTKEEAFKYGRTKEHPADKMMIANIAYENRMGNGPRSTGDGYKYRGRGIFQITGEELYDDLSRITGKDLLKQPELLSEPELAVFSACWYWETRNLNELADKDKVEDVTRKINGGLSHIDERKAILAACKRLI